MTSFQQFPLGSRYPDSPHAVASSLPTLADVRGYEEKDPKVLAAMASGYPRFLRHAYVRELTGLMLGEADLRGREGALVPDRRSAEDLVAYTADGCEMREAADGLYLVHHDAGDAATAEAVRRYTQHTGCAVGSREAEDRLVERGRLEARFPEATFGGDADAEARKRLAELCGCREADIYICASGMNAFHTTFRAVRDVQRERGRRHWLQLGWLYLDSGCVLREFLGEADTLECCYDVTDTDALCRRIAETGKDLAGVVVECPTNPLLRVGDLPRIARAVSEAGGLLMADPSIGSIYNMDVFRHCDVLVNSLTKYASHEGDVMIGMFALNPDSPLDAAIRERVDALRVRPYGRDLARMVEEMRGAPEVVDAMNANAARLADYLRGHRMVRRVFHAADSAFLASLARSPEAAGCVVSVELREGLMERFYDAARVLKGPSFGARFTLMCPFMYLAHYDLVMGAEGRRFLAAVGIDPELVRLSVGAEPYGEVEAVFAEALDAAAAG